MAAPMAEEEQRTAAVSNNEADLKEDSVADIEKRADEQAEHTLEQSLAKAAETEEKENLAAEKNEESQEPSKTEADAQNGEDDEKQRALEKEIFGEESSDAAEKAKEQSAAEGVPEGAEQPQAEEPQQQEEVERFVMDDGEEPQQTPVERRRRREVFGPPVDFEHAEIPHIPTNQKIQLIKLPNFVSIQTHPFDRDNYKKETDPETVIRWRKTIDESGAEKIESNARFVTWSDGSVQLIIGESEVLDVAEQSIAHDNNFLFSVHPGSFLRCETKLSSKVNVLPASKDSKSYQLLSEKLATKKDEKRRGKKKARVYLEGVTVNPEKQQEKAMKLEEERLRSKEKLNSERRKMMESTYKRGRLSADFLEAGEGGSDEEGGIGRIKAQFKAGISVSRKRGGDDERLMNAKSGGASSTKKRRGADDDEPDEDELPDDEDDENEEGGNDEEGKAAAEGAPEKAEKTEKAEKATGADSGGSGRKKKSHVVESDSE